ncbi:MAG: GNAT family N-acetyltransferase [Solobacterium sp.]|nr:GNAT family N-acetyltransferase [Solobacterium sp.]
MVIREYRESDRREIGEIYVANWQKTYRGLLADALLDRMDPAEAAEKWHAYTLVDGQGIFVAEEEGTVSGFAAYCPDERDGHALYLESLHIREDRQGQGIGKALIRTVGRYAADNYRRMTIHIVRGNDRAGRLYQKLGAVHVRYFTDRFGDTPSDSEELAWEDLTVFK